MINEIQVSDFLEENTADKDYFLMPFYFNCKPLKESEHAKKWGMTLLQAGTMRFRWNEENKNRSAVLKRILEKEKCRGYFVPVELIHSKIVLEAKDKNSTQGQKADGIVTVNQNLIPSVTVADCVPVFLYDTKTHAYGVFHSGWKGTGIAGEGVKRLEELYGSKKEDICAAIGPHIGSCCYSVDEERAEYFKKNFGEDCISFNKRNIDFPYSLSLTKANLFVLKNAGIKEENIVSTKDCTCCTSFRDKKNVFGSFRRQAAFLDSSLSKEEKSRRMTVQAAFII